MNSTIVNKIIFITETSRNILINIERRNIGQLNDIKLSFHLINVYLLLKGGEYVTRCTDTGIIYLLNSCKEQTCILMTHSFYTVDVFVHFEE